MRIPSTIARCQTRTPDYDGPDFYYDLTKDFVGVDRFKFGRTEGSKFFFS